MFKIKNIELLRDLDVMSIPSKCISNTENRPKQLEEKNN